MKTPLRRPLLSLLPLPLLVGWYLAGMPQAQGSLTAPPTPMVRATAESASLYPPPQVDDDEPPAAQAPTF